MAYVRVKEAGKDAARDVIKKMSKIFPRQKPRMVSNNQQCVSITYLYNICSFSSPSADKIEKNSSREIEMYVKVSVIGRVCFIYTFLLSSGLISERRASASMREYKIKKEKGII
jgi:hypothetical protein